MYKKIGIYGSGQMGSHLTTLFCGLGLDVVMFSRHIEESEKSLSKIIRITKKLNKDLNLDDYSLLITDDINNMKDCELIIEAVSENLEIKQKCLTSISNVCSEETIISSITSTKSITELANSISNPSNFIGLHFFNPPTLINFLEIVKGEHTSDEVISKVVSFCDDLKMKYIVLEKENPGFIVNRALFLFLNEAIYELYEGLSTAKNIDIAFKAGLNHPMGPLELCDFIGLDIVLEILNTLYEEYADTKYRPCYLLKQKVRAGKFGKKTKEGFYKY